MNNDVALAVVGMVEVLFLASLSAIVLRRLRFPYTVGLVLVGILLAALRSGCASWSRFAMSGSLPELVLFLLFCPPWCFPPRCIWTRRCFGGTSGPCSSWPARGFS